MVTIRVRTPEHGDQVLENLSPSEAVDVIMDVKEKGYAKFGVFENSDTQLELEMATRTGILEALKGKADDVLRLVPVVAGG